MVPPDGFAVKVTDCPPSIVGASGVIAPADRAVFTETSAVVDVALAVGMPVDESTTL